MFEADPNAVVEVLKSRAEELKKNGDDRLEVELNRAMWIVVAHQSQAENEELKARLESLEAENSPDEQSKKKK